VGRQIEILKYVQNIRVLPRAGWPVIPRPDRKDSKWDSTKVNLQTTLPTVKHMENEDYFPIRRFEIFQTTLPTIKTTGK
jgi:hypothetical protein